MCQGTPCNKSIFSKHIFESQRWALEAPKLSSKAMLLLVTRPSKTSSRKTLSERHIIVDNSNCVFICSTGREESAQLCVYVGEEKVEKHNIIFIIICNIITIIILPRWLICGGARAPHTLQTHWPPSSPGVETLSKVDRYLLPPTVYYKQKTVFNINPFWFSSLSTKSLTAIAIAALYDEGLLTYDARWKFFPVLLQQLLLCLSLQKDHRVLARIWSEWEGEHHNCWPDETRGEKTSKLWKPDERWGEKDQKFEIRFPGWSPQRWTNGCRRLPGSKHKTEQGSHIWESLQYLTFVSIPSWGRW